jgi:hypothetical protein
MVKYFLISIAWDVLRAHLAKEHKRELSTAEIEAWLRDAGFKPHGQQWIVQESDLGALDPSEVAELRVVNADGLESN